MIQILHMTQEVGPEEQFSLRFTKAQDREGQASMLRDLLARPGAYEAVATFEGGAGSLKADLAEAWASTQNGARSDSWALRPPPGIRVIGAGCVVIDGKRLGLRSSDVGDVMVVGGRAFHAVADLGFLPLGEGLECPALPDGGR